MFSFSPEIEIPWSQRFSLQLIFLRMRELRESREAVNTSREVARKENLEVFLYHRFAKNQERKTSGTRVKLKWQKNKNLYLWTSSPKPTQNINFSEFSENVKKMGNKQAWENGRYPMKCFQSTAWNKPYIRRLSPQCFFFYFFLFCNNTTYKKKKYIYTVHYLQKEKIYLYSTLLTKRKIYIYTVHYLQKEKQHYLQKEKIYIYSTLPYLPYLQKYTVHYTKTLQKLHYLLLLTCFIHSFLFSLISLRVKSQFQ